MLPKIALPAPALVDSDSSPDRSCRTLGPSQMAPLPSFTDSCDALAAAMVCRRCPAATPCLLQALRTNAMYRRGDDQFGVTGVYAGVWFDLEHLPTPVGRDPQPAAATGSSRVHRRPGHTAIRRRRSQAAA